MVIASIYLVWLIVYSFFNSEVAHILVSMTFTDIFAGRAAAMVIGYSAELPHKLVIPLCIAIETDLVLLFYPLFIFAFNKILVIKKLEKLFENTHAAAEKHKNTVKRFGFIGLFRICLAAVLDDRAGGRMCNWILNWHACKSESYCGNIRHNTGYFMLGCCAEKSIRTHVVLCKIRAACINPAAGNNRAGRLAVEKKKS